MPYQNPQPQNLDEALNELRIVEEINCDLFLRNINLSDRLETLAKQLSKNHERHIRKELLELAKEIKHHCLYRKNQEIAERQLELFYVYQVSRLQNPLNR